MAFIVADRVKETSTTTGTGTFTLAGAVSGCRSFSAAIGNGNNTYYTIENSSAGEWETGIGTYTSSGSTLSRDTVISSSNNNLAVNFSAGSKNVFCSIPATRSYTNLSAVWGTLNLPNAKTGIVPRFGMISNGAATALASSSVMRNIFTFAPNYTVDSNATYVFEFFYVFVKNTSTTSHNLFLGFACTSTGATISYNGVVQGNANTLPATNNAGLTYFNYNALTTTTGARITQSSVATTNYSVSIFGSGELRTGSTGGTFTPQFQTNFTGPVYTLQPGSYVKIASATSYWG